MESTNKSVSVIFDLDGTLVNTEKIVIPAFRKVCPKFKLQVPNDETIIAAVGYGFPEFYHKIFESINTELMHTLNVEIEKAECEMVDRLKDKILFDGIKDMLQKLADKGVIMHIASTGYTNHVHDCLKYSGIRHYFSQVHCNKPDKELMVAGIIKSYPAKHWLMVGDRRKDSKAAKYNSITGVGAGYGFCDVVDFDQFDHIVNSPHEIIDLIEKIVK